MKSVAEEKQIARETFRRVDQLHEALERKEASMALCERVLRSEAWRSAGAVFAFAPMAREPDVRPLLDAALRTGKRLALPRCEKGTNTYSPVWVQSLEADLVPGMNGILEPCDACEPVSTNPLDLALVPGVGFDVHFGRLGRGRGHYDRVMIGVSGIRCGVAFDWQVASSIPMEPHDVRLHCLVTPSRWMGPFA